MSECPPPDINIYGHIALGALVLLLVVFVFCLAVAMVAALLEFIK